MLACVRVRACVRACARARVRACVLVCVAQIKTCFQYFDSTSAFGFIYKICWVVRFGKCASSLSYLGSGLAYYTVCYFYCSTVLRFCKLIKAVISI